MDLITRASELAWSYDHTRIEQAMKWARAVNNRIAIDKPRCLEGDMQTHMAVAILWDTEYSYEYLVEEMGERVADALYKTTPISELVTKVVELDKYLSGVCKGDYEAANDAWKNVEVVL